MALLKWFLFVRSTKTLRILRVKTSPPIYSWNPPRGPSVLPSMKLIRSQSQSSSSLWMFLPSGISTNFRWMGFFQNVKKQFCVGFRWGNGDSVMHFLLEGVGFLGFFVKRCGFREVFVWISENVGIFLLFLKSWAWFSNSSFQTPAGPTG